ncbi:hypothetical protein [Nocardiopsis sp. HUAS JQ3]|uniref:hypothetical protein n=1 Tax=Nocardiopsis sp. HUAS JQ3 TaxID=3061629 RepID=UPI0023A91F1A|nr:hypothetical protein [Nocardiopsis sp. HUAS JQ3]WDZ90329.1 hypothetical protein PV789_26110 [Nocardiopsis sp. HUAS JQ3]
MTSTHARVPPLLPRGAAPTVGAVGRAARGRSAHPGLAWVRMLLLVSVLLGVAGMHTLGHASTHTEHTSPVSTASVVAHADPVPEAQAAPAAHAASAAGAHAVFVPEAQAAAGGYPVPNTHDAAGGYSDPDAHAASPVTDPTTMCLAVAALVDALVGLAAVVFLPWPGPLPRPPSSPLRRALRVAPPEPPCLAKLQVLRV